jgi:ribosomal protein S18 acetylase RimI-like enzyme
MMVKIRTLSVWLLPKMSAFKKVYDYRTPHSEPNTRDDVDSMIYSGVKMLWYGKRLATFVAENDGEIVGYITIALGKSNKFKGNAHLLSISVKTEERGKGIGTLLFERMEQYARSHRVRRIEFDVFSSNDKAISLYERLGYEVEGIKRRVVEGPNGHDDLIQMSKFL